MKTMKQTTEFEMKKSKVQIPQERCDFQCVCAWACKANIYNYIRQVLCHIKNTCVPKCTCVCHCIYKAGSREHCFRPREKGAGGWKGLHRTKRLAWVSLTLTRSLPWVYWKTQCLNSLDFSSKRDFLKAVIISTIFIMILLFNSIRILHEPLNIYKQVFFKSMIESVIAGQFQLELTFLGEKRY